MKLSVLGDRQAVSAALLASSSSGEEIGVRSPSLGPGELVTAELQAGPTTVRLRETDLEGTDLFVVVSESAGLKRLIYCHRQVLSGRSILLSPGGFAGALRVTAWFKEWGLVPPRIAEVTGFIAGGRYERRGGRSYFSLGSVKRGLPFASTTEALTSDMLTDYSPFFPDLVASDLVTTSLSNTNHMIHPGVVLLNAVRIENGEPFRFYREGLSPSTADFLHAIDQERLEIVRTLGAEPLGLVEWMLRFYGDQGMHGEDIVQCLQSFPSFEHTPSPPSLQYRYLLDDVWYGMAQYLHLSQQLGTSNEHLQTIVTAASHLCGKPTRRADTESALLFQEFLRERTGVTA